MRMAGSLVERADTGSVTPLSSLTDKSHSIPDNLVALLSYSQAWNYQSKLRGLPTDAFSRLTLVINFISLFTRRAQIEMGLIRYWWRLNPCALPSHRSVLVGISSRPRRVAVGFTIIRDCKTRSVLHWFWGGREYGHANSGGRDGVCGSGVGGVFFGIWGRG